MDHLPDQIVSLALGDSGLHESRRFTRVDTLRGSKLGELLEKDYDRLAVSRIEQVEDVLKGAGMIDPGSSLRLLGTQIESIDVLMAEVGKDDGELRRLVLVEDKLQRNPEAKGAVLFQIFRYARRLQEDIDAVDLVRTVASRVPDRRDLDDTGKAALQAWLKADATRARLCTILARGDFLLLVCGDRIHPEFLDLLEYTRRKLGPAVLSELCLLSLALYSSSDGQEHLFVPSVVGLVTRTARDVAVKVEVTVKDRHGRSVEAEAVVSAGPDEESPARLRAGKEWDEEGFLERLGDTPAAGGLERVLGWARSAPGVRVRWNAGESPTFFVQSAQVGGARGVLFRGTAWRGGRLQIPRKDHAEPARNVGRRVEDLLRRTDEGEEKYPLFDPAPLVDDAVFERFRSWAEELRAAVEREP
jgi:hypothetical protein